MNRRELDWFAIVVALVAFLLLGIIIGLEVGREEQCIDMGGVLVEDECFARDSLQEVKVR